MKYLLDTHIWLWSVLKPSKLAPAVRKLLSRSDRQVYLSPVSVWEASQLARRRRLQIRGEFETWLAHALSETTLLDAPLTWEVCVEANRIVLPQQDFGDVILAATASAYGLVLITSDEQLLGCRAIRTLSNE